MPFEPPSKPSFQIEEPLVNKPSNLFSLNTIDTNDYDRMPFYPLIDYYYRYEAILP